MIFVLVFAVLVLRFAAVRAVINWLVGALCFMWVLHEYFGFWVVQQ